MNRIEKVGENEFLYWVGSIITKDEKENLTRNFTLV